MYRVIKTVNKRRYVYLQHSFRVGKKVKTESFYIGRDDERRAMATLERENKELDAWQRKTFGETGAERQAREAQAAKFSQEDFLKDTEEKASEEEA